MTTAVEEKKPRLTKDWSPYKTDCRSWDEADVYRNSLINDAGVAARIRFANARYVVDWKRA